MPQNMNYRAKKRWGTEVFFKETKQTLQIDNMKDFSNILCEAIAFPDFPCYIICYFSFETSV